MAPEHSESAETNKKHHEFGNKLQQNIKMYI